MAREAGREGRVRREERFQSDIILLRDHVHGHRGVAGVWKPKWLWKVLVIAIGHELVDLLPVGVREVVLVPLHDVHGRGRGLGLAMPCAKRGLSMAHHAIPHECRGPLEKKPRTTAKQPNRLVTSRSSIN